MSAHSLHVPKPWGVDVDVQFKDWAPKSPLLEYFSYESLQKLLPTAGGSLSGQHYKQQWNPLILGQHDYNVFRAYYLFN